MKFKNRQNESTLVGVRKFSPLTGRLQENVNEPSGVLEMYYVVILIVVTWVYRYIKCHQSIYIKFVYIIG